MSGKVSIMYKEFDVVIHVADIITSHSVSLDQAISIAGLSPSDINEILGFEADYDCLQLSYEGHEVIGRY